MKIPKYRKIWKRVICVVYGRQVERLSKLIVQAKKIVYSFVCVEDRYFYLIDSNDYDNEDYEQK